MAHGHDHRLDDTAVSTTTRRYLTVAAVVLAVATVVGMAVLWPRNELHGQVAKLGLVRNVYSATVEHVERGTCNGTADQPHPQSCTDVTFRLTQGPDRGHRRIIEFAKSVSTPVLHTGDKVVLNHIDHAQTGFDYTYSDRQRRPILLALFLVFAVVVVALGRWRGVGALVGLGASIAVILVFVVPSMLDGNSAPVVAIVGASAVAFVALYLANGVHAMTTVALLSTLAALALTVGLATLFTHLAHFSGAANEDALLVSFGTQSVSLKGLVLAGMVLGALGALNDITVTQAAAVAELAHNNPTAPTRRLYRGGLRIGRDHISSTVNTLALAYAGASLPLLILFSLSSQSLGTVANGETVAVEIVATLVGSIGLVAAVPISTYFAATVAVTHDRAHPPAAHMANTDPPPAREPDRRNRTRAHRTTGTTTEPRRAARTRGARRPEPPVDDLLAPRDEDDFWK